MTYEEAMTRLDDILSKMKEGNLPLSELTEKIREARELVSFCKRILTQTTDDVDKLLNK
ncbi:MAG: exodeoxyribonuclease VII small subunit [Paludibacteraceae bacterium]|nr:exodeoxyribonuclease VII small subunit [Paludibacteraceae bacterium]